jgi:alkanesulfonate monooxygenase SsuD/methylene tetrahydromethanopterin reductase-like flavin-dependent oxidoreductase (luciferase family)
VSRPLGVAVALEGYGWHPEAWRHTPDRLPVLGSRHWVDLVRTAERGLVDFVTFDDGLTPQRRRRPQIEPRWLAGRPDAVLLASRVAPDTTHVGLVPVASVTHAEPSDPSRLSRLSRLSKAIATLDAVSHGRAGWQPRISGTAEEAALFGRRDVEGADLFAAAAHAVEVVRGLWDDASVVPRPPQGQPVVAALAHVRPVYEFAARSADLVFLTPKDDEQLSVILREVEDAGGAHLLAYADVLVASGGVADHRSDAFVFDGTATELVDLVMRWRALGVDGVRLRPAVNAIDLPFVVDEVMPQLRAAAGLRAAYADGETLRQRLGLPVAHTRYQKAVPT